MQERQQQNLLFHRDIAASMTKLGYRRNSIYAAELVSDFPLFPYARGQPNYLGDTNLLGTLPTVLDLVLIKYLLLYAGVSSGLTKYTSSNLENIQDWEIISRSLYSYNDLNPRKRIGSSLKDGLTDAVREVRHLCSSNKFVKDSSLVV